MRASQINVPKGTCGVAIKWILLTPEGIEYAANHAPETVIAVRMFNLIVLVDELKVYGEPCTVASQDAAPILKQGRAAAQ